MGKSNKRVTGRDDKRSSRRSAPSLRCTCGSDFLLGVGTSVRIGTNSPTLSVWVLSLTETSFGGEIGALARAPCATTEAEAMASTMTSAPSKKPSMGMPIAAGIPPFMG